MKLAVLASGEGTNAQALIDASVAGQLGGGTVGLVISDRHDAGALRCAREAEIEALFLDPAPSGTREAYGDALLETLESREVEAVCLAGFMRILPPRVIASLPSRILNVHPSLLPAFPGAHAVRDALEWGVRVTGSTVHFAAEKVDDGPIIVQEPVEVRPEDDEQSLHRRIKEVEHRLYPLVVRLLCRGRLRVEGRRVQVLEEAVR